MFASYTATHLAPEAPIAVISRGWVEKFHLDDESERQANQLLLMLSARAAISGHPVGMEYQALSALLARYQELAREVRAIAG